MSYLTRDEILAADDLETRPVDVPEWGGKVLVRALSGLDRSGWVASTTVMDHGEMVPNLENIQAKLVARSIIDDNGQRVFTDQDIAALGAKSAAALERVFKVASELSGIGDDDLEKLAGNSEAAVSGSSTSNSPSISTAPSGNSSDGSLPTS